MAAIVSETAHTFDDVLEMSAWKREALVQALGEYNERKRERQQEEQPVTEQNAEEHGVHPSVASHNNIGTPN